MLQCHCRHQSSLADDGHVFVSRGTSLDNVQGATRILESALCCGVTVTGLRAHGVFFFTKTKALSMSSPSQPGSTVSLSTSCCSLKVGTLRWNFFPELILREASSRDLPLGYAGNGSNVTLGSFQGSLNENFYRFPYLRDRHSHIHGKVLHQTHGIS